MLWAQHGGRAARLQESRAEAGVVAAPRTEAQRTAVRNGYAEAWRTAVRTEGPRGRDQVAAYGLALSEWDSSD